MDFFFLLVAGFNTGLSGAMIPGPLFLFTISEVLRKNVWAGIKVVLGHLFIEALFVSLFFLGFIKLPMVQKWEGMIVIVSALALMIMGFLFLKNVKYLSLSNQGSISFPYGPFVGGVFFSITSPGFLIWWMTLGGPLLLQAAPFGKIGFFSLMAAHWAADLVWHGFVAYSVYYGKSYLGDQSYQNIMRGLASLLIVMGIKIVYQAFIS